MSLEVDNSQTFDFKKLIPKFKKYWKYIIPCILIALLTVFIINSYSVVVYSASANIIIEPEKSLLNIEGVGLKAEDRQIQNEIILLQSVRLINKVIEKNDFSKSYFIHKTFIKKELYTNAPFYVIIDSTHNQILDCNFYVKFIGNNRYIVWSEKKSVAVYIPYNRKVVDYINQYSFYKSGYLNNWVENDEFRFKICSKSTNFKSSEKYSFVINSYESIVNEFNKVEVRNIPSSSIITVSYSAYHPQKIIDFLNALAESYIEKSIEKKQLVAINTINFIEKQLIGISDSLKYSETQLQHYQSSNKLLNVSDHAQKVFSDMSSMQEQKNAALLKLKYYKYLIEYIAKNDNTTDFVPPSSLGLNDPFLSNLLNELIVLMNEKAEISINLKKDIPYISSHNVKIENIKKTLVLNVKNQIENTNFYLNEIEKNLTLLSDKVSQLPKTQLEMFGYERNFKLNDGLYTFLLTKRSEQQISKAGLMPNCDIVDKVSNRNIKLVSPNYKKNYLTGILLGLLIPLAFIFVIEYFNDKVEDIKELEKHTGLSVLGFIGHCDNTAGCVVISDSQSLVSESFRSLRSNLQFVASKNKKHTMLITSSMTDEGKSFVSLNLACMLALYPKRTLLVCFDMRKPMRNPHFNYSNEIGLSTYLSGNSELKEIILPTPNENLSLILPGPVPPNPSELIVSDKNIEMFKELKQMFDYVIIDTPPVGYVSDAYLLMEHSDVNLYLLRTRHTSKSLLYSISDNLKKKNISNLNLVVNDVSSDSNSYGYAYGYGYGYGYGQYTNVYSKNKISKFFKFKNII